VHPIVVPNPPFSFTIATFANKDLGQNINNRTQRQKRKRKDEIQSEPTWQPILDMMVVNCTE
jgi:hypothetical protein